MVGQKNDMTSIRKTPLATGEIYHVFSKSIAGFRIFNNDSEFSRMFQTIRHYQYAKPTIKFSKAHRPKKNDVIQEKKLSLDNDKLVEIIAYCLMPTHLHLILKQLKENSISIFMANSLNSYTRYFNIRHNRKGPLWEGRFKNVHVKTDEQIMHLTRYIHLNPTSASLVKEPEEWKASSYREFMAKVKDHERICRYEDIISVKPDSYREFVLDRVSYQQELAAIKHLLLE